MHSIKHPGKTIGDFCRPDQMALVVYDMQIGIMRQMPDGAGITARVLSILTAARASNFPVIFMRHMSMPLALMGAFQRRQVWLAKDRRSGRHQATVSQRKRRLRDRA